MGLVAFKLFLAAAMSSCSITEGARECFFKLLLLIIKISFSLWSVSSGGVGSGTKGSRKRGARRVYRK